MTARAAAWAGWGVAMALAAAALVLLALAFTTPVPDAWGFRGYWILLAPLEATAGLLIARRHPRNSVGWLLLVAAGGSGFGGFAQEYATYGLLAHPGSVPLAREVAWLNSWVFSFFAMSMLLLLPQLFPTGRPLTPRWKPLLWASNLFVPFSFVVFGLRPGPLENASFVENPVVLGPALAELRLAVATPLMVLVFGLVVGSGASLVTRFRRSRGVERQQLKWVALSGMLMTVAMTGVVATTPVDASNTSKPAQVAMVVAFTTVPIAIAIAMLRHRLYDVDRIIDRALVYGALTAVLGATYVAAVVLFQAVLRPITAGSDVAVAVSTLVVVALFQPLRGRIQGVVDRRFYRARYDAARTVDAFAATLRDDVDLENLRADLLAVVSETLRPAHASVWLRGSLSGGK